MTRISKSEYESRKRKVFRRRVTLQRWCRMELIAG